jgi:hypothetical protein
MKKSIDRIVIETIVEQSIQGFHNDPHREIRKLVDLGASNAKSHFQQSFFALAQDTLTHDSSPYYRMITQIVQNFPSQTIKQFFINVGYNSWIKGTRAIRLMKAERGHNIPWTLIFKNGTRKLRGERLYHILEEARALGICTFFFFTDEAFRVSEVLNLAQDFSDCAFILLTSAKENRNADISSWKNATNCLFLLQTEEMDTQTAHILSACRENGVLYGIWMYYDAGNSAVILNGKMNQLAEEQGAIVFLLVQGKHCAQETAQLVKDYVSRNQLAPKHAVFITDLYSDVMQVAQIISNANCVASISSDGKLMLSKSNVTVDLCSDTLLSGLRKLIII